MQHQTRPDEEPSTHRTIGGIAVGLLVTQQPPHRSRRAVFPHRALRRDSLPQKGLARGNCQTGFGSAHNSWSFQYEVLT